MARVMERFAFRTRSAAVDYALRRLVGLPTYDPKALLKLRGIGWKGDLEGMRRTRNLEW